MKKGLILIFVLIAFFTLSISTIIQTDERMNQAFAGQYYDEPLTDAPPLTDSDDISDAAPEDKPIKDSQSISDSDITYDTTPLPQITEHSEQAIKTSGEYLGQKWFIDENHLLWWDGEPYIPYGLNAALTPKDGIKDFAIWSDPDFLGTDSERFEWLDRLTDKITEQGGTYFMLFLLNPELRDLSDLNKPRVKSQIELKWRKFAPAVRKKGLRAITFFNEINMLKASRTISLKEYGRILNDYAKSLKEIVGNVPVILKIGGDWNIEPIMVTIQGDYVDGLGGDFFASEPDENLKRQMVKPTTLLNQSKKTKLFWITELSRAAGGDAGTLWLKFENKNNMRSFLKAFLLYGATGFFYFDIHPTADGYAQVTQETAKWFRELKSEVVKEILSFKKGG